MTRPALSWLQGEKLADRRARLKLKLNSSAGEIAEGEKNPDTAEVQAKVAIAREAYERCLNYGGDGDGPKRSVLHFCGKWLPLGEGANRKGQLVCCVRETIGWKYQTPEPKPGKEEKPSAARGIGFLCREFFISKAGSMKEPSPAAPGLMASWQLHKQRTGA